MWNLMKIEFYLFYISNIP